MNKNIENLYITSSEQEKPPVNKDYMRLYHHHSCPYSERIRLVLADKNIKYQSCEVDQ